MGIVARYAADQKKLLIHIFYCILACAFIFFCSAIAVASARDILPNTRTSPSFVGLWSVFLVASTGLGHFILNGTWTSAFQIGCFLGLTSMLSQYFFTITVLFIDLANQSQLNADATLASFSFFLFVLYGIFTILLLKNRGLFVSDAPQLPPTPNEQEAVA